MGTEALQTGAGNAAVTAALAKTIATTAIAPAIAIAVCIIPVDPTVNTANRAIMGRRRADIRAINVLASMDLVRDGV